MLPQDEYYDELTEEQKLFERRIAERIKEIEDEHSREDELEQR